MKLHRLVTVLITQARKQSRFRHNCRLPTVAMPYCSDPVAASGATRTTAGEPDRTVLASPCMPERKTKPKCCLSLRKRGAMSRSDKRRVGTEWVSTCRYRWWPDH